MKILLSIIIVVFGVLLMLFVMGLLASFHEKHGSSPEFAISYAMLDVALIFALCFGVYNVYILIN